jgi:hypothetical protein
MCDWSFLAFHRFTAVITTTSLIVLRIFEIPCFDDWQCGFHRLNSGSAPRIAKMGFPPISTALERVAGFILCAKASKVRQR